MRFRKVGEGKFKTGNREAGSYLLEGAPGSGVFCSCRAFFYRGACKHSRALVAKLEREARRDGAADAAALEISSRLLQNGPEFYHREFHLGAARYRIDIELWEGECIAALAEKDGLDCSDWDECGWDTYAEEAVDAAACADAEALRGEGWQILDCHVECTAAYGSSVIVAKRSQPAGGPKLAELFPQMDVQRQPGGSYKLVEVP